MISILQVDFKKKSGLKLNRNPSYRRFGFGNVMHTSAITHIGDKEFVVKSEKGCQKFEHIFRCVVSVDQKRAVCDLVQRATVGVLEHVVHFCDVARAVFVCLVPDYYGSVHSLDFLV